MHGGEAVARRAGGVDCVEDGVSRSRLRLHRALQIGQERASYGLTLLWEATKMTATAEGRDRAARGDSGHRAAGVEAEVFSCTVVTSGLALLHGSCNIYTDTGSDY